MGGMAGVPMVAILEPERERATALQEVVSLARCSPIAVLDLDELTGLSDPPAAIIVRVATSRPLGSPHAELQRLPASGRPKVLALVSSDADVAEAQRLGCDVVLREPHQVRALYDALIDIAGGSSRADDRE